MYFGLCNRISMKLHAVHGNRNVPCWYTQLFGYIIVLASVTAILVIIVIVQFLQSDYSLWFVVQLVTDNIK